MASSIIKNLGHVWKLVKLEIYLFILIFMQLFGGNWTSYGGLQWVVIYYTAVSIITLLFNFYIINLPSTLGI